MQALSRQRFPLRWFLIFPYIIQIFLAVGLTGWLSHQNGEATVKKLASKILVQAKYRVNERTDRFLMQAQQLAVANAFAYEQNYISLSSEDALQTYLWQQLNYSQPMPRGIYLGDEQGQFLEVEKGNFLSIANPKNQQLRIYQLNPKRQQKKLYKTQPYDPRQRPWYQQAKNSNEPIWTESYPFATLDNVGITAAKAVRNSQGQLLAVSAVDLSLNELNAFLRTINISPSAKVFIVNDQGQLIASSTSEEAPLSDSKSHQQSRIIATKSSQPVVRQSANYLLSAEGKFDQLEDSGLIELPIQNQRHYLSILPYRLGGAFNWNIVVVVSERDFTQQITQNNRITLLLCVVSVFVSLAVGTLTSRVLAYPIKLLEKAIAKIIQKDWGVSGITAARTREMGNLVDAFELMVKRLQQVFTELENYAYQDTLTGLPNRAALLVQLDYAISVAQYTTSPGFAVLWLDIDSLVRIETGLGEHIANQLLKEVALRLQKCLQPAAAKVTTLARIERDDFVILLGNLTDEFAAQRIAETILQDFQAPFQLDQQDVVVTVSVGLVIHQGENDLPETILQNANMARLEAKRRGKDCYVIFDHQMRNDSTERLQLEADLRYAIERDELEVWYQPIITVDPNRTAGFEALIRWRHPISGLISPDKFILIAEETGVITAMGLWILRTSCQQMQEWQTQVPHLQSAFISVNVSAQQLLLPDFIDKVERILQETGLRGESLQLEVTESAAVSQPETISPKLLHLKSLGINICMDDFGTGYCQLSYLVQLPVDAIKIDRSFVNEIGTDNPTAEIAKTLLTLSKSLALDVTAEGVETSQQFWDLRSQGCLKFQGYLFSAPMETGKVPDFQPLLPTS